MDDKIKIHISKSTYNTLLKDCEAFEFYKNDNKSLNKNLFLTRLINNYYKSYQEKENHLINLVSNEIDDSIKNKKEIVLNVVHKLNKLNASSNNEKFSSIISLKPTKESSSSLAYIEKYLLNGLGLSEYFRNLFTSYCSLPQDQREKIIFKTQYDTILKAIKENKKIFFTTTKGRGNHESCPYQIATSKEELHCYLLAKYNNALKSFRLSRIIDVTIINQERDITPQEEIMFNKMIQYGPEFTYVENEELAIVKLTDKGKSMYKSLYVHRPIVDYVEGDFYYFSCSHNQVKQYFQRFGKEAFIVSPKELQIQFYNFYKTGMNSYIENNDKRKHKRS